MGVWKYLLTRKALPLTEQDQIGTEFPGSMAQSNGAL